MKKVSRLVMLPAMNRYLRLMMPIVAALLLAACGTMRSSVVVEPATGTGYVENTGSRPVATARTAIPGGSYQVQKGDTLYSIAFRKGVDFRDLAQWNAVAAPYTIWPGQQLKLAPLVASTTTSATPVPAPRPASAVTAHPAAAPATPSTPLFESVTPPPVASTRAGPNQPNGMATTPRSASVVVPKTVTPAAASTTTVVPVAGMPMPSHAAVPPPAPSSPVASAASRAVSGVSWRWPAQGSLVKHFQSGDAIPGIEIAGSSGDPVRAAADGVVVYSGNGLVGYGELVIIKHSDSFLSAYGHNSKRLVKEGQRVSAGQQIAVMGSTGATRNELEFQIRKDGNPVDPLGYLPPR